MFSQNVNSCRCFSLDKKMMTEQGIFEEQPYLFRKALEILSLPCSKNLNTGRLYFLLTYCSPFCMALGLKYFLLALCTLLIFLHESWRFLLFLNTTSPSPASQPQNQNSSEVSLIISIFTLGQHIPVFRMWILTEPPVSVSKCNQLPHCSQTQGSFPEEMVRFGKS